MCSRVSIWGARDGTVVRALASHQWGPALNPGVDAICGLSLLLVLSFAPRGFSPGTPVFPSPQKPSISKFQFDQESGRRRTTLWMCYLQIFIYLFIYLYLFLYLFRIQLRGEGCRETWIRNGSMESQSN